MVGWLHGLVAGRQSCAPHPSLSQKRPLTTPLHVGAVTAAGLVGAPACGDVMKLQIRVDDEGNIVDSCFKTFGCGSAIASSSVATEWVKGKSVEEVRHGAVPAAMHQALSHPVEPAVSCAAPQGNVYSDSRTCAGPSPGAGHQELGHCEAPQPAASEAALQHARGGRHQGGCEGHQGQAGRGRRQLSTPAQAHCVLRHPGLN